MAKINIINFIDQVKQEVSKVTWPSKRETTTSTITVIVMVSVCSVFFLLVDMLVHNVIQFLLGIGN
jgi:preprotein translocase subunit SecE